ncbi:hypothetical protein OsI_12710 [Oryza sativa Indica Group]|uniref:Uncharacterized protein n=1 Tax=Oryza sativa subsp. indica TaxID=39946 RepID=A2XJU1_ORYSI|nr:hypothetical protein OsI_12710 [Oryza sativa Indica Group]
MPEQKVLIRAGYSSSWLVTPPPAGGKREQKITDGYSSHRRRVVVEKKQNYSGPFRAGVVGRKSIMAVKNFPISGGRQQQASSRKNRTPTLTPGEFSMCSDDEIDRGSNVAVVNFPVRQAPYVVPYYCAICHKGYDADVVLLLLLQACAHVYHAAPAAAPSVAPPSCPAAPPLSESSFRSNAAYHNYPAGLRNLRNSNR